MKTYRALAMATVRLYRVTVLVDFKCKMREHSTKVNVLML